MNGTEQRQRQSAVAQIAKRQDNVELVVEALAKEMVVEREARTAAITGTRRCCDERWDATAEAQKKIFDRSARIDRYTLWERLRVLVRGR